MRSLSEGRQRERKAGSGQVLGPWEPRGVLSHAISVSGAVLDARGAEVDRPGPWLQGMWCGRGHEQVERLSQPWAQECEDQIPSGTQVFREPTGRDSSPGWEGLVKASRRRGRFTWRRG